jgi:hypothetical protein
MKLGIGKKHPHRSMELIVVRWADYIGWMIGRKNPKGQLAVACVEAKRLIAEFDRKPILRPCMNRDCALPATLFSLYIGNISPCWWCAYCNPYSLGARRGKLVIVMTYEDALDFVTLWCGGTRLEYKAVIRAMAEAKGLPRRVGEREAQAFFSGSVPFRALQGL